MAIILIGFFTDVKLPFGIPVGLAALLVGTAIGWIGGYMSAPDVGQAARRTSRSAIPTCDFDLLVRRAVGHRRRCSPPRSRWASTTSPRRMSNVESAAAAGDNYNLRSVLLADGTGAVVGSALGSPFPPAVYIGHPGWKAAGGRTGYSLATGVVIALAVLPRAVRAARRAAAGAGDRADPALHRPADRRAGVPGGAASARRRRRGGDHPEHRVRGQPG